MDYHVWEAMLNAYHWHQLINSTQLYFDILAARVRIVGMVGGGGGVEPRSYIINFPS